MIQLGRQNAMAATVPREEHHFASAQFTREETIRRRPERRFHINPFLIGETLDVIKAAAADDSNSILRHNDSDMRRLYRVKQGEEKVFEVEETIVRSGVWAPRCGVRTMVIAVRRPY